VSLGAAAQQNAGGRLGRPFVVVSILLHAVAFFCAVGLPRWLSSGPTGNKVYVVDLVTLPGSPAAAAPAPAPAAAAPAPELPKPAPVKPPEIKKAPETKEPPKKAPKPIVLPDKDAAKKNAKTPPLKTPVPTKPAEPEKKDDKKDDAKESEESAAEETAASDAAAAATPPATNPVPAAAPAKPGATGAPGATGTGVGGEGTGTGGGDEFDFYISLVKRKIEAAWKRPVSTSRQTLKAAVYIELAPNGGLLKLELRNPSGFVPFDRSIVQAVRDAEPFPPFPSGLRFNRLNPTLQFELAPLDGADAPP